MSTPRCPECSAVGVRTDDPQVWVCSEARGYKFKVAIEQGSGVKRYDKFGRQIETITVTKLEGEEHE